jgi:hypothetical protein
MVEIRFYYYSFIIVTKICYLYLWIYSLLNRNNIVKTSVNNSIAILPYYPIGWPGANRTTAFKSFFENDNIQCVIFEAWTKEELEASLYSPFC